MKIWVSGFWIYQHQTVFLLIQLLEDLKRFKIVKYLHKRIFSILTQTRKNYVYLKILFKLL